MSRLGLSTVSAAALSFALLAAPAFSQGFTDGAEAGLAKLGIQTPPAESLTTEQVGQITNILNTSEPDSQKRMQIEEILGMSEATATGRLGVAQMRSSATSDLAQLGVQADVETLTLSQLGQIQNVVASSDNNSVKKQRVEEILGNEATATGRLGVGQLQDSAAADLAAIGVDAEMVEMLTISQLGQIENVMNSSVSDSDKRAQVEKILAE
jgi:hypothetical protein